jgi:hypothetical protein
LLDFSSSLVAEIQPLLNPFHALREAMIPGVPVRHISVQIRAVAT